MSKEEKPIDPQLLRITTFSINEYTARRLRIAKAKYGYKNFSDMLNQWIDLIQKLGYTKLDVECMITFGKIPMVYESTDKIKIKGKVKKHE
jgi:hypothetical protein